MTAPRDLFALKDAFAGMLYGTCAGTIEQDAGGSGAFTGAVVHKAELEFGAGDRDEEALALTLPATGFTGEVRIEARFSFSAPSPHGDGWVASKVSPVAPGGGSPVSWFIELSRPTLRSQE